MSVLNDVPITTGSSCVMYPYHTLSYPLSHVVQSGAIGENSYPIYNDAHRIPLQDYIQPNTIPGCANQSEVEGFINVTNPVFNVPVTSANDTASSNITTSTSESTFISSSSGTKQQPVVPAKVVIILNACLSFIKSEMNRRDEFHIIETTTQYFSFEELKEARKSLFEATELDKRYMLRFPQDITTNKEKSAFCANSLIIKLKEMESAGSAIQIACPAEDLFRISQINNKTFLNVEQRLTQLENEMKDVKAMKIQAIPSMHALPYSSVVKRNNEPQPQHNSRANLLKEVTTRSPSIGKRHRSEEEEQPWNKVENKRPKRQSFWNNTATADTTTELLGDDHHEVYLMNYKNLATPEVVKNHFLRHKIRVINVRLRSRPESSVKSFVMKIECKEDFEKIIEVLPYKTGARWYISGWLDFQNRPRGHFNKTNSSPAFLLDSQHIPTTPRTPSNIYTTPQTSSRSVSGRPSFPATATPTSSAVMTNSTVTVAASVVNPLVSSQNSIVNNLANSSSHTGGLTVTSMITPLTSTHTNSTGNNPAFQVGAPMTSLGESMSITAVSTSQH